MTKQEYLEDLRHQLKALPPEEIDRTVTFYAEAIDDRMEAGLSEAEAIADMEPPQSVAEHLVSELPAVPRLAARFENLKLSGAPLVLAICAVLIGSPLWVSLLAAGILFILAIIAALLALLVGAWALDFGMLLVLPFGFIAAIGAVAAGSAPGALAAAGMGLCFSGIGLLCLPLLIHISKLIANALIWLFRKIISLFTHETSQPHFKPFSLKPVLRMVLRIAIIMVITGAIACFAAWALVGFDAEQFTLELNRGNEILKQIAGLNVGFFISPAEASRLA